MITIEAYRAAIGGHNRYKQIKKSHARIDFTSIIDVLKTLSLISLSAIPLYFMLLTLVCIMAPHFTILMFIDCIVKKYIRRYAHILDVKIFQENLQVSLKLIFGLRGALIVPDTCVKFGVLQIWGPKGSKMEFFQSFLKSMHRISIIIRLEETIMVLDVCIVSGYV